MSTNTEPESPLDVLIVAIPETAGSTLYGMVDVLSATGTIWQTLARSGQSHQRFRVRIVSPDGALFSCGHRIPVNPDVAVTADPCAPILVLPDIWLGPDETMAGRHPELIGWIRRSHGRGSTIYSACSGAILLAETGLLDGCPATSHWGYEDLFRRRFPKVHFDAAPNLVYADPQGSIVTAGGTTSWHDLVLHLIARHANPGEAIHIAKVYLLKWHEEGERPYTPLVRPLPHGDAVVRSIEHFLQEHFRSEHAIQAAIAAAGIPERTLKRRFRSASGVPLIDYLQNLRIEHGKHLLETTDLPVEEISAESGYADSSFFRRLFRRRVGLTPGAYRRMFGDPAHPAHWPQGSPSSWSTNSATSDRGSTR